MKSFASDTFKVKILHGHCRYKPTLLLVDNMMKEKKKSWNITIYSLDLLFTNGPPTGLYIFQLLYFQLPG